MGKVTTGTPRGGLGSRSDRSSTIKGSPVAASDAGAFRRQGLVPIVLGSRPAVRSAVGSHLSLKSGTYGRRIGLAGRT